MRLSLYITLIVLLGITSVTLAEKKFVPNKFYSYKTLYNLCNTSPATSTKTGYISCVGYTNDCALKNIIALIDKRHGEQKASLNASYQALEILMHSLCTNYTVSHKYLYGRFDGNSDDYTTQLYLMGADQVCRQSFIMAFIDNISSSAPVGFKFQCRYNPDHQ